MGASLCQLFVAYFVEFFYFHEGCNTLHIDFARTFYTGIILADQLSQPA